MLGAEKHVHDVAALDNTAVIEHGDAVGNCAYDIHAMRDQYNRQLQATVYIA